MPTVHCALKVRQDALLLLEVRTEAVAVFISCFLCRQLPGEKTRKKIEKISFRLSYCKSACNLLLLCTLSEPWRICFLRSHVRTVCYTVACTVIPTAQKAD